MAISRAHLELETLSDTLDHVLDVRADGTNAGQILTLTRTKRQRELYRWFGSFQRRRA